MLRYSRKKLQGVHYFERLIVQVVPGPEFQADANESTKLRIWFTVNVLLLTSTTRDKPKKK